MNRGIPTRSITGALPTLGLVLASLVAGVAACSSNASVGGQNGAAGGAGASGSGGSMAATAGGGMAGASSGGTTATTGGSAGSPNGGGAGGTAGAGGLGGSDGCGTEFVALLSDLSPYSTWMSYFVPESAAMFHDTAGPRTIYINQLPPKGATSFPIGTIIVKVIDDGTPGGQQIFAMVKRGGCFNDFAPGWEWFGLDVANGTLGIQWRGVTPPLGAGYGGVNVCNNCHADAQANDYVQAKELQLQP